MGTVGARIWSYVSLSPRARAVMPSVDAAGTIGSKIPSNAWLKPEGIALDQFPES